VTRRPLLEQRRSGVLLHMTSLSGPRGSGDLGPAAHAFVDFLASAAQSWWQVLPVGPPGAGRSPYDSPSAFAGSPELISLELLRQDGLLADLGGSRERALRSAYRRFSARPPRALCRELEERGGVPPDAPREH